MKKELIKGQCEECGFAFVGEIGLTDGAFNPVICPNCGHETENFDSAGEVDERNKSEKTKMDYKKVTFK